MFEPDPHKANRALWDFYQLSFKNKFPKAVGFVLDDGADCVSQIDVGTNEEVAYCAPNPDKGVKYIAFEYSVDLKSRAYYPESDVRTIYNRIETFAEHNVDAARVSQSELLPTDGKWKFMHTQHLRQVRAMGHCYCYWTRILRALCATNNIVTTALAVLTISLVCCCVLGSMVLWMGISITESICLTILAGFCVDYIVHLAHSYMEVPIAPVARPEFASVGHMGVSVLSGALTSSVRPRCCSSARCSSFLHLEHFSSEQFF